jgi:hypothetical protein
MGYKVDCNAKGDLFLNTRFAPLEQTFNDIYIRELERRLYDGSSVTFTVPRNVATTLVHEVLRGLWASACYTAHIDLSPLSSVDELALTLMRKYLELRTGDILPTANTLEGLLDNLSEPGVGEKIRDVVDVSYLEQMNEWELLDEAAELAQRIAEADGKRLVVWFNAWQEVLRIGGDLMTKRLRAMLQHHTHVTYAFVGSDPALMRTLFAHRHQAFYRFAVELKVPE